MTQAFEQPIGIFDSGIGGLSITRAVAEKLPQEHIIYFGDTLHMPYGEKSAEAIQAYVNRIVKLLLEKNCKLILIACNSASAAAYDSICQYVAGKALVMNVIDPLIEQIKSQYAGKKLGLIGTKQTINSQIYLQKVQALNLNIELQQRATPLLAAAIEEQFNNQRIVDALIVEYLSHPDLQKIDGLILGCTHYPIIASRIAKFYDHAVEVIDACAAVAESVHQQLSHHALFNKTGKGEKQFYVSDYTDSFVSGARLFFDEAIQLQHYPLF